jgi:hypothetical protein
MSVVAVMHTRACFDAYGWWDDTIPFGGDIELWLRIAASQRFTKVAFEPVVAYQDAMLYKARTTANFIGLRYGVLLGQLLEAAYARVRWMASPSLRFRHTQLRRRTRLLEERVRLESRTLSRNIHGPQTDDGSRVHGSEDIAAG